MNPRLALPTAVLLMGLIRPLAAQVSVDLERFQRQLEQIQRQTRLVADLDIAADRRALIDYGGFASFNFLAIDDVEQSTHVLRQSDLNGYIRFSMDSVHEMFVRVRSSYRDFNEGDAFTGGGDDWVEPTLDRAHYRFDLQRYAAAYEGQTIAGNVVFQGGRQLVHWASGLALSREIDGAVVRLSHRGVALDLLAGVTRRSTTDIDRTRPGFTSETRRHFYGGMLSVQVDPRHRPFIYALVQRDHNDDETLSSTNNPYSLDLGATSTRFRYHSHYLGLGSTGAFGDQLIYGTAWVYQGGRALSNSFDPDTHAPVIQSSQDIEAWAVDLRLDYLFNDTHRTRWGNELVLASGDTDRRSTTDTFGGNEAGTADHAFNGFGLINTGLAFGPPVSNLLLARSGISTFPLASHRRTGKLQVGADLFIFNKLNREAPIDEATTDSTFLGWESDLFANWQLTSDLSVALRYGVFFPGNAIVADHDARHFFYSGFTLAF